MYIAQQTIKKFPQFRYDGFTTDQLSLQITIHIQHITTGEKYQLTLLNPENIILEVVIENWLTEKIQSHRDNTINNIIK